MRRIVFKVAAGTGIVLLLTLGARAQSAQEAPAIVQTNHESTPAAPAKPNAAPPAATSTTSPTSTDPAPITPAAAAAKSWKCLYIGLAEKNYDRRAQAIAAIGTIGLQRRAISLIEASLNDKDTPVRRAAVEVLGTMKSRSSIPKLLAALDDNSPVVRFAAARALWAMGDRRGQELFLDVLDGDRKVSNGLVTQGFRQLHTELHDPKALAELGSEEAAGIFLGPAGFGVLAAIELSKDKAALPRALSAKLLADDPSDGAREALRDALQDKSWIVRAAAAEALGFHGSLEDVATLAPLLDDQQKEVRYRAAAAIIRVTSRRAR